MTIRVAQDKATSLESAIADLEQKYGSQLELRIEADPNLQGQDCVLESKDGVLNASVTNHMKALESALGRIVAKNISEQNQADD